MERASTEGAESMRRRVLVCDDEDVPRRLLETALRRRGFETYGAADGIRACELAEEVAPDLVLLDLMLPGRDGYTVLLHLRGLEGCAQVPVFIVSAEPREAHDETATALGAQGYIQKPFDLPALLDLCDRATDREPAR